MNEIKGGKVLDDGNIIIIDDASPPASRKNLTEIFANRVMNADPEAKISIFSVPKGVIPHPILLCEEPKLLSGKTFHSSAFTPNIPPDQLAQLYEWHKASAGKNLILYLKAVYFDQVKSGTKPWEYRECKEYWKKRIEGKTFDFVEIRGGSWGEKRTMENTLFFPWRGYEIQELTHSLFGADPVLVYAIRLVK